MSSTTAGWTINILRELFATFGIPQQLVSDNSPQFVSKESKQFMIANGVKRIRSSPYHPASNGAAERMVQTLKLVLKADNKRGIPIQKSLANFLLHYRYRGTSAYLNDESWVKNIIGLAEAKHR